MHCRKCGDVVDPTDEFCVNCGTPVRPKSNSQTAGRRSKTWVIILAMILVLLIGGGTAGYFLLIAPRLAGTTTSSSPFATSTSFSASPTPAPTPTAPTVSGIPTTSTPSPDSYKAEIAYQNGEVALQTAENYGQQAAAETDENKRDQLLSDANRQAQLALDYYWEAVELNPLEAGYRTSKPGCISGLGNLLYQFAMTSTDTAQRNALRDEARNQWQIALKTTIYLRDVFLLIGRSYQQEADEKPDQRTELLQKAAENFEAGAQADPGDFPLYFQLVTLYEELGEYDKAIAAAEKGIVYAQPTENRVQSLLMGAQVYFNYGATLASQGNTENASAQFSRAKELAEEVLLINPDEPTAKDILNRITSGE